MADLLHRLAARTLGQAPTLTPRVPTRYEPASGPSIVDTEVTAPGRSASTVDVEPAVGPPATGVGRQPPRLGQEPPVTDPAAVPARRPAAVPEEVRPRPEGPHLVTPDLVTVVHAAAPAPAAPATAFPAGRSRVGSAPAAPLPPLPPPAPASPRRGARATPPDVHITIGRIEVRAEPVPAPAAAARPQPTQLPPEPAVLTLSAYLRGDDGRPR